MSAISQNPAQHTKPCRVCGVTFEPRYPRNITCSELCWAERVRIYNRKYRADHFEAFRRLERKRYAEKRATSPRCAVSKTCVVCRGEFLAARKNELMCSTECKRKRATQRRRKCYLAKREEARPTLRPRILRSDEAAKREHTRPTLRACDVCGYEFQTTWSRTLTCSAVCSFELCRMRGHERYLANREYRLNYQKNYKRAKRLRRAPEYAKHA